MEPRAVTVTVFEALNAHDLAALRALYAENAQTRRPGWPGNAPPEALLASYEMDFACVPDINFEPISVTADGDRFATEVRITGTNSGPTVLGDFGKALLGNDIEEIPPTGRQVDLPAVFVHEVKGDRIAAERQYWGLLEFLVQIGVIGG